MNCKTCPERCRCCENCFSDLGLTCKNCNEEMGNDFVKANEIKYCLLTGEKVED